MTAKRFTYDSKTVSMLKDGEFWLDGNVDTACNHSEICNELNKLIDENEQLKQEMGDLGTAHAEEINKIEDDFDEELLKLEKENEQLKKELDCFKPLIFETDGMPITLYEKKDGGDVE